MSEQIEAIFENGVFRPQVPVNIPSGERVLLNVERNSSKDCATSLDEDAARKQFEKCFGSVDLARPVGIDNIAIDSDLAREYGASS
jgi:predicted DNA-binding antitoxin AbrB/MazE fold protein